MDDFEARLRRRLRDTAAEAGSAPDLSDVGRRARRQRRSAGAMGAGGTLLAVALLAVAVILLPEPDAGIELDVADEPEAPDEAEDADEPGAQDPDATESEDREDGDEAEPEEAPPADGSAPARACGSLDALVMVVATTDGGLEALCEDGDTVGLESSDPARNLTVAPDGAELVFESERGGASVLLAMDAESGSVTELGEGRMPAFSPEGALSWLEGEETAPTLAVAGPDGERAAEHFMGTLVVTDTAWDTDARQAYLIDTSPAGAGLSVLDAFDADATPRAPAPPDAADGGRFLAVATSATTGEVGLVRRVGGEDRLELVTVSEAASDTVDITQETSVALDELDMAVDPARVPMEGSLWLADAGLLRPGDGDEPTFGQADDSATTWLLGDGQTMWLVSSDGSWQALHEQAQAAAVNPARVAE